MPENDCSKKRRAFYFSAKTSCRVENGMIHWVKLTQGQVLACPPYWHCKMAKYSHGVGGWLINGVDGWLNNSPKSSHYTLLITYLTCWWLIGYTYVCEDSYWNFWSFLLTKLFTRNMVTSLFLLCHSIVIIPGY